MLYDKEVRDFQTLERSMSLLTAVSENTISISGRVIRLYRLDDGRQVIHGDDMTALMAAWNSGNAPLPTRAEVGAISRYLKRGPDA